MTRATALLLVVAIGCKSGPRLGIDDHPVATATVTAAEPASCIDDSSPFDIDVLRARVAALASKELDGRAPGTPGDRAARALIAERFRCLGLAPAGDAGSFEQRFVHDKIATANVVGVLRGADPARAGQIIVVGAHHDHLGGGHLGANDNASGVVALLAIAQALRQRETAPARTIAFVTFGAEEVGFVGSRYFLAHPIAAVPLDKVVQYINIDMVGTYSSNHAVGAYGSFRGLPARVALAAATKLHPKLFVVMGRHHMRGDHGGFCAANIPYVSFSTHDKRCYHAVCDTAENIDHPDLAKIAAIAGNLVERLADTDVDLAASRAKLGCLGR